MAGGVLSFGTPEPQKGGGKGGVLSFDNPLPEEEKARQSKLQSFKDTGVDMAKSGVAGVRSGIEGTGGMVGDISQWQRRKVGDIMRAIGAPEGLVRKAQEYAPTISTMLNPGKAIVSQFTGASPDAPTSEDISSTVDPYLPEVTKHEPTTRMGKYAKTVGEFAPGLIGGGGLRQLGQRLVGDVIAPAIGSETMGQMTEGTMFEGPARFLGGLIGGPALREQFKAGPITEDAQLLRDRGVDLSAGQATNSRTLKTLESELGGGTYDALIERQRRQFSDQVMQETGAAPGTNARPEELNAEYDRLGRQYRAIEAAAGDVPLDVAAQQRLMDAQSQFRARTGTQANAPTIVDDYLSRIGTMLRQNPANPSINGDQLSGLRHDLGVEIKAARDAGDSHAVDALTAYQDTLNAALEAHLQRVNPDMAGQLAETNRQYRNYLDVERAVTGSAAGGEAGAAAGVITPTNLRGAIRATEGRRALALARGDLTELANAGTTTIMNAPSNSGTAARTAARTAPAAAGAVFGMGGSPEAAAAVAGATVAPWAAGRGLMSRPVQEYLMQAPSRERQALAAILAAQQEGNGGGGW